MYDRLKVKEFIDKMKAVENSPLSVTTPEALRYIRCSLRTFRRLTRKVNAQPYQGLKGWVFHFHDVKKMKLWWDYRKHIRAFTRKEEAGLYKTGIGGTSFCRKTEKQKNTNCK